jgi:hypothetical protein
MNVVTFEGEDFSTHQRLTNRAMMNAFIRTAEDEDISSDSSSAHPSD